MTNKIFYKKKTDILTLVIVTILFCTVCIGVLAMPMVSVNGAKNGLIYSFNVLIPSLFPFMFLSAFAVEYGISSKAAHLFAPFTEKLLYLPGESGVTVLLSLIGGFPVGASGINALVKQGKITQKQAQRMLWFCVNPGPAFLITVVGAELYKSELIGIVLFAAQVLSSLMIGIILGMFVRKKEILQKDFPKNDTKHDFSSSFILSAKSACAATINLCALVVLFSSFSAILLTAFHIDNNSVTGIIIRSFLEVTDGSSCIANAGLPIYIMSLAVGWSGICVHFQIFAAAESFFVNKMSFFIARLINGAFSALFTIASTLFLKADINVFSNFENSAAKFSSATFYGSIALFTASILFLLFLNTYIREAIKFDKH